MRNEETLRVWSDLVDNPVVLSKDELKFIVVSLELLFLEQYNLCALWNLNANTRKALRLTNEGQDLCIEVDVQLVIVGMSDDQSREQACFGLLNFHNPSLPPFIFEVEQSVSDAVMMGNLLHWFLRLFGSQQLFGEVLHGYRCSVEEMARPGDGAGDGRQVADNRWLVPVLLILVL